MGNGLSRDKRMPIMGYYDDNPRTNKKTNVCYVCGYYIPYHKIRYSKISFTLSPWKNNFHKKCFHKMISEMMTRHNIPYAGFGRCFCGALFLKCNCGRSASTCVGCCYNKLTSHFCVFCF